MDTVFIRNLALTTIVGIHPWERDTPRTVVLDLELAADCARAAASDAIADALDYDAVSRRLRELVESSRFELIETLAQHCATLLIEELGVPWVRLTLHKPGALGAGIDVGVTIERGGIPGR